MCTASANTSSLREQPGAESSRCRAETSDTHLPRFPWAVFLAVPSEGASVVSMSTTEPTRLFIFFG